MSDGLMSEALFTEAEVTRSPQCPRMEHMRRLHSRATVRALTCLVQSPLWPLIKEAAESAGYKNPVHFTRPISSDLLLRTSPSEWSTLTRKEVCQRIIKEAFSEQEHRLN